MIDDGDDDEIIKKLSKGSKGWFYFLAHTKAQPFTLTRLTVDRYDA